MKLKDFEYYNGTWNAILEVDDLEFLVDGEYADDGVSTNPCGYSQSAINQLVHEEFASIKESYSDYY